MASKVFITGASSGFGKAMAIKYASHGFDLIITGRRIERLVELQHYLCDKYNIAVIPLCFDVQNKDEVFSAIATLKEEWKNIEILINNAGLAAGRDYFDEAALDDWETMIDTNIKGVLYVTKALLPFMIDRFNATGQSSHIINVGSIAGKEVYEKGNVYCATKSAVDAISQSMRIDLLRYKIRVTAIHPGAAETEFSLVRFKGDKEQANKIYEGYKALSAEDVADVCFYCTSLPNHVCINDLTLTCTAQANSFYLRKNS